MPESSSSLKRVLLLFPQIAGFFAVVAGLTSLTGWLIDSDMLKRFWMGEHLIQPNLALCLLLAGLAVTRICRLKKGAVSFIILISAIIILISLFSLLGYFCNSYLLLDGLFYDFLKRPGLQRLSPVADSAVILLVVLFLMQSIRGIFNLYVVNLLSVLIFSIGFIGFSASVFNLTDLVESKGFIDIADVVWLILMLLSGAIFAYNFILVGMKLGIEHQLVTGLTFITVIIIFIAANANERINNIHRITNLIQSTMKIKESLRTVQSHIFDLQSGVRGYILSSDERFLESPELAVKEIPASMAYLDSSLKGVPEQRNSMVILRRLVDERITQADRIIAEKKNDLYEESARDYDLQTGKLITDSIRVVVKSMIAEENKLLFLQNNTEIDRARKARSVIFANLFIQVVLIAQIFRIVIKNIREKRNSLEEIKKINENLEIRIKRRTAMLEASENKYKFLFENNPLPMMIFDARTLAVFEVNDAAIELYGYSEKEFLALTVADIRPDEDVDQMKEQLMTEAGKYIEEKFVRHVRKNGEVIFVETFAHPLTVKGRRAKFVLINDVTIKKTAEDEIREMNESLELKVSERTIQLESANRTKSDFLANMSHEIRTPMNAILGYSELLSSLVEDDTQKDYLNSIKSSGRTLLTLINDILDLSKIEAGRLELEFDFVEALPFFSEFEKIFAFRTSEKGLKFITDVASGTPAFVYVDAVRLRQVILNLVGNAVKFTKQGSVTIRVFSENPRIKSTQDAISEEVIDLTIEVADTGIGIPEDFQDDIFGSFIQVRSKMSQGGTGLGLAISKRLVELMNGTISVNSKHGTGSTFIVKIPEIPYMRSYESENSTIDINPYDIVFDKARILIVDDVEENRKFLKDALSGTSIDVIEATDGGTALALMRITIPDLVITDIRMPGMDGFTLLSGIKEDENLKHVPVIAYSASVMKEQKERIRNSQFAGLLIKPVSMTDLYLELTNNLGYHKKSELSDDLSAAASLAAEEIRDPEGLIVSLEGEIYKKWKTFEIRQPIGEIKNFSHKLINLGQKHNCKTVINYGEELLVAASSFNIEAILKLLKRYSSLAENLKKQFRDDGV